MLQQLLACTSNQEGFGSSMISLNSPLAACCKVPCPLDDPQMTPQVDAGLCEWPLVLCANSVTLDGGPLEERLLREPHLFRVPREGELAVRNRGVGSGSPAAGW
jgi:hypothetical protein